MATSKVVAWWTSSAEVMWPMTATCAALARAGAVRVSSARGRPVPGRAQDGRERVDVPQRGLEHGGELGLDHEQAGVAGPGVGAVGVAQRPHQAFAR